MKYFLAILLCIACFVGGYFTHTRQDTIRTVTVTQNVDHYVYRDYSKVDCCAELQKYDKTPINISYTIKDLTTEYTCVDMKWNLYQRDGNQIFNVPVYQSGNWKFYTGLAVGAVAVGAASYGIYKITH